MAPQNHEQLRRLLTMTEEILELAHQKQWDEIIEKEQQRRRMMEELLPQPAAGSHPSHIEDLIRQIITLNSRIITMAESGKLEILKKMRNLSAGQHAIEAYASNSS